ncbi:DUF1203 domain-containing protein [Palleronia caenipelagi]|uniref:DUF1203 domain-containing protein n=1 Tax=Palleronia caenipelagi TaxID=2489174 RepID=UPI001FEA6236|nr:DUF1203 domain-containing protein [Palleronia caenipelagi]
MITSRLISLRVFDDEHMMTEADVLTGTDVAARLKDVFEDDTVSYAQLHFAKPGCFAALAKRGG